MKTPSLLLALGLLSHHVSALGQSSPVTTDAGSGGLLKLAGGGVNGQILLSADDWWGVLRAAQDLAGDFGKVTGKNLTLGNWVGAASNSTKTKRGLDLSEREFEERREVEVEKREWSAPPTGKSVPTVTPSWESKHRDPPMSGEHEAVVADAKAAGTTVYYKFQPVTSFVNVSLHSIHHPSNFQVSVQNSGTLS